MEEASGAIRNGGTPSGAGRHDEPLSAREVGDLLRRDLSRAVVAFVVLLGVALAGTALWAARRPRHAESNVGLHFVGADRGKTPGGEPFRVADLVATDVVATAAAAAGLDETRRRSLEIQAVPVVPTDVRAKWALADRIGAPREDYFPTAARLRIGLGPLSAVDASKLAEALAVAVRARLAGRPGGPRRVPPPIAEDELAAFIARRDVWDIHELLTERIEELSRAVDALPAPPDDERRRAIEEMKRDAKTLSDVFLSDVRAAVKEGGLATDRGTVAARLRDRAGQLALEARAKGEEAATLIRLAEAIAKARNAEADLVTVDKAKVPALGALAERVFSLAKDAARASAEEALVRRRLALVEATAPRTGGAVPPALEPAVARLLRAYRALAAKADAVDAELRATAGDGGLRLSAPVVVSEGPSTFSVGAAGLLLSALGAVAFVLAAPRRPSAGA